MESENDKRNFWVMKENAQHICNIYHSIPGMSIKHYYSAYSIHSVRNSPGNSVDEVNTLRLLQWLNGCYWIKRSSLAFNKDLWFKLILGVSFTTINMKIIFIAPSLTASINCRKCCLHANILNDIPISLILYRYM